MSGEHAVAVSLDWIRSSPVRVVVESASKTELAIGSRRGWVLKMFVPLVLTAILAQVIVATMATAADSSYLLRIALYLVAFFVLIVGYILATVWFARDYWALYTLHPMDSAEAVIEAIRLAFANVPRGSISLHEAEVIDDYGSEEERAEARRLDTESSWDRVPDSHIEECTSALCHLDPHGWKYYVPAYMIWTLGHFGASDSVVPEFTIYTFDPSVNDPRLREYSMERFRLLDSAQSGAVCRFLRYIADRFAFRQANEALAAYWARFC